MNQVYLLWLLSNINCSIYIWYDIIMPIPQYEVGVLISFHWSSHHMFYFHRQAEAELLCLQCLILPCINSLFSLSCCLGPRSYPVLKKIMLFMLLFLLLSSVGYGEFHICLCLYLLENMRWHHPERSIIVDLIFQHVILSADFCLKLCNRWERKKENGGRETFF